MKRVRQLRVSVVRNAGNRSWWIGNNPNEELVDDVARAAYAVIDKRINT